MAAADSGLIEIKTYLEQYSKEVGEVVEEVIGKVAKEATKKLKNTSPKKTGKYAKGWAVQKESSRIGSTKYTVYGKSGTYQLAHLLEHGHANRYGGRTGAIVHISPVEEWAITETENRIVQKIESGV